MNPLKDVHVLIPGTCECVTLHGTRKFAHVIILRTLKWENYSELSGWRQSSNIIAKVLKRSKRKAGELKRNDD